MKLSKKKKQRMKQWINERDPEMVKEERMEGIKRCADARKNGNKEGRKYKMIEEWMKGTKKSRNDRAKKEERERGNRGPKRNKKQRKRV